MPLCQTPSVNFGAFSPYDQVRGSGCHSVVLCRGLTWDELIHTAYFNVPRFRKLVAFCLIDGKRIMASEIFKRDTEFERIASWAAEIRNATALVNAEELMSVTGAERLIA